MILTDLIVLRMAKTFLAFRSAIGSNISLKVDKHKKGKFNNISEIAIVSLEPRHEISDNEYVQPAKAQTRLHISAG